MKAITRKSKQVDQRSERGCTKRAGEGISNESAEITTHEGEGINEGEGISNESAEITRHEGEE